MALIGRPIDKALLYARSVGPKPVGKIYAMRDFAKENDLWIPDFICSSTGQRMSEYWDTPKTIRQGLSEAIHWLKTLNADTLLVYSAEDLSVYPETRQKLMEFFPRGCRVVYVSEYMGNGMEGDGQ